MPWGWPWPSGSCGCCTSTPVVISPTYHIKKYTNSSSMSVLATQADNRDCLGLMWDGSHLVSIYDLTEPGLGTASGTDHFMRAIDYNVSFGINRQVLHDFNSPAGVLFPATQRSVFRCGDGSYCMSASRTASIATRSGTASRNSDGTFDWEQSSVSTSNNIFCVVGDGSGNVYAASSDMLEARDSSGVLQWIEPLNILGGGQVRGITIASDGFIWTVHSTGKMVRTGPPSGTSTGTVGSATAFTTSPACDFIGNLYPDNSGGIWVGGNDGAKGIFRFSSAGIQLDVIRDTTLQPGAYGAAVLFGVDSSNNVYGLTGNAGTPKDYKIKKWTPTGSGTGSAASVLEWTSPIIGWNTGTGKPRAVVADSSFIFVGGQFGTD